MEKSFTVKKRFSNPYRLMKDVQTLDRLVYPKELWGTVYNELKRYFKNTHSFICLYNSNNEIIAYFCYCAVNEELRDEFLRGDVIRDDDISSECIERFRKGRHHRIYIISMVVHPDYRGGNAMKTLAEEFFKELEILNKGCCFIDEILATAVSDNGCRVLEKFGLKKVKNTQQGYTVYECSYDVFMRL